jgi:hypothetical protein
MIRGDGALAAGSRGLRCDESDGGFSRLLESAREKRNFLRHYASSSRATLRCTSSCACPCRDTNRSIGRKLLSRSLTCPQGEP